MATKKVTIHVLGPNPEKKNDTEIFKKWIESHKGIWEIKAGKIQISFETESCPSCGKI